MQRMIKRMQKVERGWIWINRNQFYEKSSLKLYHQIQTLFDQNIRLLILIQNMYLIGFYRIDYSTKC